MLPDLDQRFETLGMLGQGAMGVVYRARERLGQSERLVALKVLKTVPGKSERARRLWREGEITANLSHPGIVRVHTVGRFGGRPCLAYELVEDARTLGEVLRDWPLRRRIEAVRDVARALGYAHEQGVVHRDVKPENVLVDRQDRIKVADFGLAAAQGQDRLTQTGAIVGTFAYLAPEQLRAAGKPSLAPAVDTWALGVVLYEALTDVLPFEGDSPVSLAARIIAGELAPPRQRRADLPADLETICLRALDTDPERRYVDGTALAADLDAWLNGEPLSRQPRPRLRLPPAFWVGLISVAAALLLAAPLWSSLSRARQQEELSGLLRSTEQLITGGERLRGPELERLRERQAALGQLGLQQASRLERRLQILEAFYALSRGRSRSAQVLLASPPASDVDADPVGWRPALAGGLAAVDTSAPAAPGLDEALAGLEQLDRRRWDRPELLGWWAELVLRRARDAALPPERARAAGDRALSLLASLPPPLLAGERRLQVEAMLLAGRLEEAAQRLAGLDPQPLELRWRLLLARLPAAPSLTDLQQALAQARELPPHRSQVLAETAWRRLLAAAHQAGEALDQQVARGLTGLLRPGGSRVPRPDRLLALLQLAELIEPGRRLPPAVIEPLLGYLEGLLVHGGRDLDFSIQVAKLVVAHGPPKMKIDVMTMAARTRVETASRFLELSDRALRHVDPADPAYLAVSAARCRLLFNAHLYAEFLPLAEELLAQPLERPQRLDLLEARAKALHRQERYDLALPAIDALIDEEPARADGMASMRAVSLEQLGRGDEAFVWAARALTNQTGDGFRPVPARIAWDHGHTAESGRQEELRRVLALTLKRYRGAMAKWWARLAILHHELGDDGLALEALAVASANARLDGHDHPAWVQEARRLALAAGLGSQRIERSELVRLIAHLDRVSAVALQRQRKRE